MATSAKHIIPAHATHPGSVLKSELQARGLKQKDFAEAIGLPQSNLSDLIKGIRHITEAIALKLEECLDMPFQTWMNLQNRYHFIVKRREELAQLKHIPLSKRTLQIINFRPRPTYSTVPLIN